MKNCISLVVEQKYNTILAQPTKGSRKKGKRELIPTFGDPLRDPGCLGVQKYLW